MAKLPAFFAKMLGKADDVADVAKYGDDVLDVTRYGDDMAGLVADSAGRAVMSPELLSDDFLDAVDDFAYHTPVSDTTSHILGNVPPETALNYKAPKLDWNWNDLDPTSYGQAPMITPGSNRSYKIRDLDVNYGTSPEDAIIRNSPIEGFPVKKYGTLFSDGHYQILPTTVPPITSGRRKIPVKSGSTLREFMENNYPWRYDTSDIDLPF